MKVLTTTATRIARLSGNGLLFQKHAGWPSISNKSLLLQLRSLRVAARPSDLVGDTPLLDLTPFLKAHGVDNGSKLYGKMESLGALLILVDETDHGAVVVSTATCSTTSTDYCLLAFAITMIYYTRLRRSVQQREGSSWPIHD